MRLTYRFRQIAQGRRCLVDFAPQLCSPPFSSERRAAMTPPPIIRASFISFEIRWEGNLGSMLDRAAGEARSFARAVSLHPSERAIGRRGGRCGRGRNEPTRKRAEFSDILCLSHLAIHISSSRGPTFNIMDITNLQLGPSRNLAWKGSHSIHTHSRPASIDQNWIHAYIMGSWGRYWNGMGRREVK